MEIRFCIFLLFFFIECIVIAQTKDINQLFQEKKYNEVIRELEEIEQVAALSIKEYFLLSESYSKNNEQHLSLKLLNSLIPELIKHEDFYNLSIAYNHKAENLIDLSKTKEGSVFCDRTLAFIAENKHAFFQELCLKCGILYHDTGQNQKAFNTYKKIKKELIKQTPVYINNYGAILMKQARYEEALNYLKKGVKMSYSAKRLSSINVGLNNIAQIYVAKEKWDLAKIYLDSAEVMLDKSNKVFDRKSWLFTYYDFFKLQNRFVEAENVVNEIENNNTLIYNYEIDQKIKELSSLNERKDILIKKVSFLNKEKKLTNKSKLTRFIILISVAILMISWAFLMVYKNTKLKYQKVVNEQKLLSLQMTPHFIFNAFSIVQGMILNKEQEKAGIYLSKFSNILKFIIKEHHDFVPIQEEIIALKDYVDLQNLSAPKKIDFSVKTTSQLKNQYLIPPMILQPFIENAIIHGFKKHIENPIISLEFVLERKTLRCYIIDNGIGYLSGEKKEKKGKTSLAIKIVEERFAILSKKMNHNFSVNISDLKERGKRGTEVLLKLPYHLKK